MELINYLLNIVILLSFAFSIAETTHDDSIDEQFYDPFTVDSRDWRLAFRGTQGINDDLWDAYRYNETVNVEPGCLQFEPNQPCTHHYRNNAVFANWRNIEQVAFVVYSNGSRVAHVIFNVDPNTDFNSWFDHRKIASSSWTDISAQSANIFSIVGHHSIDRRFFMEHTYGGCPNDSGWFVAVDMPKLANDPAACDWERKRVKTFPQFIYSTKTTLVNWNVDADVGVADVIAIFVKYSTSGNVIG